MIQSPYYELTERMPLIMVAAAICYRAIADDEVPTAAVQAAVASPARPGTPATIGVSRVGQA